MKAFSAQAVLEILVKNKDSLGLLKTNVGKKLKLMKLIKSIR